MGLSFLFLLLILLLLFFSFLTSQSFSLSSLELDLKLAGGYAFDWVQELCGMNFLSGLAKPQHRHIGDVFDAIRKRADSLLSLKTQVDHLR